MASDDALRVICRFRPLNKKEKARNDEYLPSFTHDSVTLSGKTYNFDRAFGSNTPQKDMYEGAAQPVVKEVLNGFNGTIFAYGQTGSGKTHSMDGELHDPEMRGIIPRIIDEMFYQIGQMDENLEMLIKVSYVEIYMEKIQDLLNPKNKNLPIKEDEKRVPYIKGVEWRYVADPQEVLQYMDEGKLNRTVASTEMNAGSSRSHSIFTILVTQKNVETKTEVSGRLNLVDLAGSEKVAKTDASGQTLEEAKKINLSLSALGNVMAALTNPDPTTFIPYRSSCLTRMLQDSLGGNCKTTMIICCSPSSYNEAETKSTMAFGVRAKSIKNSVTVNEVLTADQWEKKYKKLKVEKERFERLYKASKKEIDTWRSGEPVPESAWADFGAIAKGEQAAGEPDSQTNNETQNDTSAYDTASEISMPAATSAASSAVCPVCRDRDNSSSPVNTLDRRETVVSNQDMDVRVKELYDQVKEKNDRINILSRQNTDLQSQCDDLMMMLEENAGFETKSTDNLKQLESERDQAKSEAADIMQALEDMAQSYDTKEIELQQVNEKMSQLGADLQTTKNSLQKLQAEMASNNAITDTERSHKTGIMHAVIADINEMGILKPEELTEGNDEFTAARLLVSKMKSEVKALKDKCTELQSSKDNAATAANEQQEAASKLKITQQENKINTLSTCLKDVENKRRALEDQISEQQEIIARLQSAEITREHTTESADEVNHALELQKVQHKEQIERIRQEIDGKNAELSQVREESDKLKAELAVVQEKSQQAERQLSGLSNKLKGFEVSEAAKKQAQTDLQSLQETTSRELASLSALRKQFVGKLLESNKNSDNVNAFTSHVQRHRIDFLENNLNQLTNAHKSLVQDNTDLKCELPKLQKRNQSMMSRVKHLENELRKAKENSIRDRQTYQQEVDKIKEQVRQKYMAKKRTIATIARPIRAGQRNYGTTFQTNR